MSYLWVVEALKLLKKQENAVYYLMDDHTMEVYYGGAAGGGKSALGCLWLIDRCQNLPGTRWLMGRAKLKTLKQTTLATFFELASKLGISEQFNYNQQQEVINWDNGSQIILKDLFFYPSDPEFDSLGSLEITGAFIDECPQVVYKAWQIVKSRIRYRLNEFGLIPKMLGTGNPAKNWSYTHFYKPKKDGQLPKSRAFIQALPNDNPHLPPSYIESLNELDKQSKERLLYGNWEYDDDPSSLCDYDNILAVFTNNHLVKGDRYITADVARLGSDKAVIMVWHGWVVVEIVTFDVSKTTDIQSAINALRSKHQIPAQNVVADEDGVGGGVVDNCNIKGFVNNAKALMDENYMNLQSQCCYKLAEKIQAGQVYIEADMSDKHREEVIEELEQLKSYEVDKGGKLRILPKEKVKEAIGRSPDWRDALMMRAFFDFKKYTSILTCLE